MKYILYMIGYITDPITFDVRVIVINSYMILCFYATDIFNFGHGMGQIVCRYSFHYASNSAIASSNHMSKMENLTNMVCISNDANQSL